MVTISTRSHPWSPSLVSSEGVKEKNETNSIPFFFMETKTKSGNESKGGFFEERRIEVEKKVNDVWIVHLFTSSSMVEGWVRVMNRSRSVKKKTKDESTTSDRGNEYTKMESYVTVFSSSSRTDCDGTLCFRKRTKRNRSFASKRRKGSRWNLDERKTVRDSRVS